MNLMSYVAFKQSAFSEMVLLGMQPGSIISFLIDSITKSAFLSIAGTADGHLIRCPTPKTISLSHKIFFEWTDEFQKECLKCLGNRNIDILLYFFH